MLLTVSGAVVRLWNLRGELLMEFVHAGPIVQATLNSDSSVLAVVDEEGDAELWQLGEFDELHARGCALIGEYLSQSAEVSESDRALCP